MTLQDRFVKGKDQEQREGKGGTEAAEEEGKVVVETKAENAKEQVGDEKIDEDKTEVGSQKTGKEHKAMDTEGGEDKENQA